MLKYDSNTVYLYGKWQETVIVCNKVTGCKTVTQRVACLVKSVPEIIRHLLDNRWCNVFLLQICSKKQVNTCAAVKNVSSIPANNGWRLRESEGKNIIFIDYWYVRIKIDQGGFGGLVGCTSDWFSGGHRFNSHWVQQHCFMEIDHEILSAVILSLPLIQEGQLAVFGKRMCTSTI